MMTWDEATARLQDGSATLLSLWGETDAVHLALLLDGAAQHMAFACADGRYPSLGRVHPPAIRLERAARDLHGLRPEGMPDPRPWLDHGEDQLAYPFLPVEGAHLHQVPVGPVHAGIIEPGHFRFTCDGETVVRVEQRLGYVHRGVEAMMQGMPVAAAARIAARICGDSTVAYSVAFAFAAEQATGTAPPPRAVWLRALLAELERLANHLGDVGAICNDASFALMQAHCAVLRERTLRAVAACFGHRLMMDVVVPGGVSRDLAAADMIVLRGLVAEIRRRFPPLVRLYDATASLQDRTVGTGILRPELAQRFGAGGYVGRASGRAFDARRTLAYAPYGLLRFEVPTETAGDVNARVWVRIREITESLGLIEQILDRLPEGVVLVPLAEGTGEGMALVEGFRGDVLVWLRIADGCVRRVHARDPSWFHWPLLEAAIEGNIIADFPLCNKSFNGSYAGHDL
ncbi:MAG: nickel-dependent hydrogenase large subunit [Rhodospirillales bacterium]|nr:nickel-dependent hydrogenase large subunit [Rhodospirillales bacterium]